MEARTNVVFLTDIENIFFKVDAEGYFGHSAICFEQPVTVEGNNEKDYDDEEGEENEGVVYIDEDIMDIDNDG